MRRRAVKAWTWRRAVLDYGPANAGWKLSMLAIARYMNDDGEAWPSQALIARKASTTVRTVRRHILAAKQNGWLHVEEQHRGGRAWKHHVYRACVPESVLDKMTDKDADLADMVAEQAGDVPDDDDDHGARIREYIERFGAAGAYERLAVSAEPVSRAEITAVAAEMGMH